MRRLVSGVLLTLAAVGTVACGGKSEVHPDWQSAARRKLMSELSITPLAATGVPPFTLHAVDGGAMSSDEILGRPALLYFWAMW